MSRRNRTAEENRRAEQKTFWATGEVPHAPDSIIGLLERFRGIEPDLRWVPPRQPKPTTVRPGPDKVNVIAERLLRGEELWHEDDPTQPLPVNIPLLGIHDVYVD